MEDKRLYGLIGYPLGHTFSPGYFAKKFSREGIEADYRAYEIEDVSAIESIIDLGVQGLNVTIPYKEEVMQYLDDVDEDAAGVGAVNTIKLVEGRLVGYNTDVYGFQTSLERLPLPFGLRDARALILGTGGSSKAVSWVFKQLDIEHLFVSRSRGNLSYDDIDEKLMSNVSIIVNTTPLGMHPNENEKPSLPVSLLGSDHLVFDLIYNPEKTLLLSEAEKQGCLIKNGAEMLVLQAEKSWTIWNS